MGGRGASSGNGLKQTAFSVTDVKYVAGQTFGIKDEIKKQGFKWNGSLKRWERG